MSSPPSRDPLSALEYAAIAAIVVIWGVNNAAAKVATEILPPMLVGALRFAAAGVFLAPFVRPPFPDRRALILVCLLAGPLHFGLLYLGFALAHHLSPLVISLQLWAPFTALFAWVFLKEQLSRAAIAGLVIAFAGVAFMTADPHVFEDWRAIAVGLGASAMWALGMIAARRASGVTPLKMQGLISFFAAPALALGSLLFEHGQVQAMARSGPWVWASMAWAAFASTIVATVLLFWLVQRREPGRITPYMLTTPLVSGLIGVGFMHDHLTPQILTGAAAVIGGVALVALAERRLKAAGTIAVLSEE